MSLFTTLDVSGSGLAAQRTRVEILAQNIANAETTRTDEGGPYRRRRVTFEAEPQPPQTFRAMLAGMITPLEPLSRDLHGVRVSEVTIDDSQPERRYLPDHPDADAGGFVEFPSFNPVEDMVDLTSAVRSYQANLAVISAVKEMINRSLDISR